MKYYWRVVMNNGKEYMIESPIADGSEFVNEVFKQGYERVISCHQLKDGSSVIINSKFVSSIELNFKI